jgi:hypothetical protein
MCIGWPHASGWNSEPIIWQFRSRPKMQRDWDIRLAVADICDIREIAIDKAMNHAREKVILLFQIEIPLKQICEWIGYF